MFKPGCSSLCNVYYSVLLTVSLPCLTRFIRPTFQSLDCPSTHTNITSAHRNHSTMYNNTPGGQTHLLSPTLGSTMAYQQTQTKKLALLPDYMLLYMSDVCCYNTMCLCQVHVVVVGASGRCTVQSGVNIIRNSSLKQSH